MVEPKERCIRCGAVDIPFTRREKGRDEMSQPPDRPAIRITEHACLDCGGWLVYLEAVQAATCPYCDARDARRDDDAPDRPETSAPPRLLTMSAEAFASLEHRLTLQGYDATDLRHLIPEVRALSAALAEAQRQLENNYDVLAEREVARLEQENARLRAALEKLPRGDVDYDIPEEDGGILSFRLKQDGEFVLWYDVMAALRGERGTD